MVSFLHKNPSPAWFAHMALFWCVVVRRAIPRKQAASSSQKLFVGRVEGQKRVFTACLIGSRFLFDLSSSFQWFWFSLCYNPDLFEKRRQIKRITNLTNKNTQTNKPQHTTHD